MNFRSCSRRPLRLGLTGELAKMLDEPFKVDQGFLFISERTLATGGQLVFLFASMLFNSQPNFFFFVKVQSGVKHNKCLPTEKKVSVLFSKLKDKVAGSKQLLAFVAA